MSTTASQVSEDTIDAIRPDLEAFASLWAALRANYEGTNITKTVARLLHMYQPEDGIQAYERLLKTLSVLLEGFDPNGLRLLVSMVPPPKGSPDETIRNVFMKATGFVRIDAPMAYQNYPLVSSESMSSDPEVRETSENVATETNDVKENIPPTCKQFPTLQTPIESPQDVPKGGIAFGRFLSTVSAIPQAQKGAKGSHEMMGDVKGPLKIESSLGPAFSGDSSALGGAGYKLGWLPPPLMIPNGVMQSPNAPYRDLLVKTVDNKYLRVPVAHCPPAMHYFPRPCQVAQRMQPAGKSHTITSGSLQQENSAGGGGLKDEMRVKTEQTSPKRENKPLDSGKNRGEKLEANEFNSMNGTVENFVPGEKLVTSVDAFCGRIKKNYILMNSPKKSRDLPEKSKLDSDLEVEKLVDKHAVMQVKEEKNSIEARERPGNFSCQPTTMAELGAYKRQYYDALLSVQRAKLAVANSLTLPAMQTCGDFEAYPEYWLYQQPQRFLVNSYGQRFVAPDYSGNCMPSVDWRTPYPVARSVQDASLVHPGVYNSCFMYPPQRSIPQKTNVEGDPKMEAKKRKLENIVVKLKEGDLS